MELTNELAEKLDGMEYGTEIPQDILDTAKENNIVIIMGYSDDILSVYGAVLDEAYVCDGYSIMVDDEGIIASWEDSDKESLEKVVKYVARIESMHVSTIKVHEGPSPYTWTYDVINRTQSSVFDVMENGDKYCQGHVFKLG